MKNSSACRPFFKSSTETRYSPSYQRALWILQVLDAGFLTAMKFETPVMRQIFSVIFVVYYLLNSEQVTEKLYKSWRAASISSIRVSWEKGIHPLNRLVYKFWGPKLRTIQQMKIRRESGMPDITVWIYYHGTLDEMRKETSIVLQFPGGGFVSIPTPCHESYLIYLAYLSKVPIVSVDYRKAPEFPYPNGLNDCFEIYVAILKSNGKIININENERPLKVACMGDSSGGNLATGVIYRCIQSGLPVPQGVVLCYPTLNLAPNLWLSPDYYEEGTVGPQLSSLAKYINDDILLPNLVVKMISAYLTKDCDPIHDIYLSPLVADDAILKRFPKTYIHCGSLDPLSDDSKCFAKRLQKANEDRPVELYWFRNLSHGYLLLLGLLPEAEASVSLTARWLTEILDVSSTQILK